MNEDAQQINEQHCRDRTEREQTRLDQRGELTDNDIIYLGARETARNELTEKLAIAHMMCTGSGCLTEPVINRIRELAKYIEESHERTFQRVFRNK